jgi:four helix bundle protein
MKENVVKIKSFDFALRIVKLYQYLAETKKKFILAKQILRSGTTIGANTRESEQSQSKADFIHKLSIALKEAKETKYWIEILLDKIIYQNQFLSKNTDVEEIMKLLTSIIKTTKKTL